VQHERAVQMVTEGAVDLGLTVKPAEIDGLTFEEIASDVAHLVCRADDPLARRKTVRWRELSGRAFIGITRISSVRRLTDAAFVHAEIAIAPRYEVEQIASAVALVEANLGVTALPSLTFSMFRGRKLAVRPLVEPSLRRNVGFVTAAGRTLPQQINRFAQIVRSTMRKELAAARP
jgi:LysR family carnitine catabolism transcriptional activator